MKQLTITLSEVEANRLYQSLTERIARDPQRNLDLSDLAEIMLISAAEQDLEFDEPPLFV